MVPANNLQSKINELFKISDALVVPANMFCELLFER